MSISEKIKSWLPGNKEEEPIEEEKDSPIDEGEGPEEEEVIENVSVDDFEEDEDKMAPEVKAEVREEDIVKEDGKGNKVPSYL